MARAKQVRPVHQMTTAQFEATFPDEDACKAYLKARRWPDGVRCPRCGNPKVYALKSRAWHWQCENCSDDGYRFSVIAGTIYENTNKPLRDWFRVIHMMMTSKKGVSALQVMRTMGFGSYKTAWYMCHRVRLGLSEPVEKLGGIVEIDETFVGGKSHNRHRDKRGRDDDGNPRGGAGGIGSGKTPVVGAVSRKGKLIASMIENVDTVTLNNFVHHVVDPKTSTLVCTDEYAGYRYLNKTFKHEIINHRRGQYVIGAIHTNTIEGFWSIMKRGVIGTYHKVSAKYLGLYVAEFQFRYNNRNNPDIFGEAIAGC